MSAIDPTNFPEVHDFKDSTLHAFMEGWTGFDGTYDTLQTFHRISQNDPRWEGQVCVGSSAGLGGDYSLWAGALQSDVAGRYWCAGQGYGKWRDRSGRLP